MKLYTRLIVCLFLFETFKSSSAVDIILESENVTEWGDWGPWQNCPHGSYASAFQLKTQAKEKSLKLDDTGLNAIKLFCSKPGSMDWIGYITSSEGEYGDWGLKMRCSDADNGFIDGFMLRALKPEGGSKSGSSSWFGFKDDIGATNLRVFCSPFDEQIDGDGLDIGEWGRDMRCMKDQYVCGIRTQVEHRKKMDDDGIVDERWLGFGDYTGLNNVQMKCCDGENPGKSCVPTDDWDTVFACDAIYRTAPFTCTYDKQVGVTDSKSGSSGTSVTDSEAAGQSVGVRIPSNALAVNFGINYSKSKSTGHDWKNEGSSTFDAGSSTISEFTVMPGQLSVMKQIVGKCGDYIIRTTSYKVEDYDKSGNLIG